MKSTADVAKALNKSHPCLFTLIVYTQDKAHTDLFMQRVRTIIDKFPCRIIFITCDHELSDDDLKVSVTTEIGGKKAGESIASDLVRITCNPKTQSRVPFLILPILIPDLPVFLLWGQDPTVDCDILPYLQTFATRIIFDSECTDNLRVFSEKMLARIKSMRTELVDLNWATLRGWREIFSKVFDSPDKIHDIKNAQSLFIHFKHGHSADAHHAQTAAIFLQGWLAAQFGWTPKNLQTENNSIVLSYEFQGKPIHVELIGREEKGLKLGDISSVEVITANRYYIMQRKDNTEQIVIHVSTKESCELPLVYPLGYEQKSALFWKEVFYQSMSEHYKPMLEIIKEFDWKKKCDL